MPKKRILPLLLLLFLCAALFFVAFREYYKSAYPIKYADTVLAQSEGHRLPPGLVYAVIRTESGFRPGVESSVGARGLMQITEETFDWVKYRTGRAGHEYDDLYDPDINIEYGAALLRLLLDEFVTAENALCAYHAGWGNAKAWLQNPGLAPDGENISRIPFGDTDRYVRKVLSTWKTYQGLYHID